MYAKAENHPWLRKKSPTYKLCGIDELWHIGPEGENILASILPNFYTEWKTEQRLNVFGGLECVGHSFAYAVFF